MNENIKIRNFYFENEVYINNFFNMIKKQVLKKKYKVIDEDKLFKDLLICFYNNSD